MHVQTLVSTIKTSRDHSHTTSDIFWVFLTYLLTFGQTGKNTVTLLVMDAEGNQSEEKLDIWVGNSPPKVSVELEGNS